MKTKTKNINSKSSVILTLSTTVLILFALGLVTFIIDPYCHYRKTDDELIRGAYADQRYINDGIVKYFSYDAVICGTSMVENVRASEVNEIYGVNAIKVPFPGASFKEINNCIKTATMSNSDIKIVIRGLDYDRILDTAEDMRYDESMYPTYLYNGIGFDDLNYLLNKDLLRAEIFDLKNLILNNDEKIDFDNYSRRNDECQFGKEAVELAYLPRPEKSDSIIMLSADDRENIYNNITENVVNIARENENIEFYCFLTPYSIYFWDSLNQEGSLDRQIDAEKYVIELILQCDNIHLFSYNTEYDMICNLGNYRDAGHYGDYVQSQILKWMKEGYGQLTLENYESYIENERQFYSGYDYDALFN